jgi:DNA (cytosine-5)-methyltransferase 1
MTAFSRLSQFGMTYRPLTESLGEELLMSYLAGFHAKTSVPLEKAQALTESDRECGEKWRASFVKFDPAMSLWKTHQCSLLGDLDEFSETWPQWGLMRNGECWEQQTLEQTTRGTGFGLSPNGVDSFHTPNTTGLDGGSNSRKALKKKMQNWTTPTAHMAKETNAPSEHKRNTPTLTAQVNWATPTVCGNYNRKGASKTSGDGLATQVGGKLNPMWVEWLMGWPLGWTDLKPLEMDKSHCVQQLHGDS